MANLLEQHGARSSNKEPKFIPIFIDRAFTGLFSQRAALHDPSDLGTLKFYGGRPDSLWMGSNIELSNRLTLQRRPGLSPFSTVTYPTAPLRAFSFELINNTIQVIIDTGSTGNINLTSVNMASGNAAVYVGAIGCGGANNGFAGMIFQVSGFLTAGNNGTFTVLASTTTTLTLQNPLATPETDTATAISSGAVYVDNQNGTKTLLFGKAPGAGQTYFVAVAGTLYMGDGVDTNKYTPLNTNGTIWKWGIVAPAKPPAVTITESASAAIQWQANTVWSTMGLIYVTSGTGIGSVQQLISTNALNTNVTPQFNTTGSGGPNWNQTPGGTTPGDGSINWTNKGPIDPTWHANKFYSNGSLGGTQGAPAFVWDSVTQGLYINGDPALMGGTSGFTYPHFIKAINAPVFDGTVKWFWTGLQSSQGGNPQVWQPTHAYPAYNSLSNTFVVEPLGIPPATGVPNAPPIYVQGSSGGTSGTGGPPSFSPTAGNLTSDAADGSMTWLSLGLYSWASNHAYSAWTTDGAVFSVIRDTNNNFQVCTTSGTSGFTQPAVWNSTYGGQTTDGSVVWTCVGVAMQWAANTIWFRPTPGFSPPSSSSPYGGASVIDSNGDVEFVINSGKGGSSTPSWNTPGGTTTDGAATWFNTGLAQTQSLTWKTGLVYAYSFKARSLTDFYSVDVAGTSTPPVPPGLTNPLPAPTGSETGVISTASPTFIITGGNAGAVNTISGFGSTDPQVDTIVIWRSADGGGSANMFELTEIPSPPPINGIAQPWTFKDFLPDNPTNLYPGLNILISAPINESNNPPASTFLPMVYNFTRIWGAEGQQVNFSGGPDVLTGNPNEAFNPADELPFLAQVINLVKTTQGIVTFLTDGIELIAGGPATSSFFSVELCPNVGLLSYNFLDVHAGEIYFFSADNQLYAISPSLNLSRVGFPIGDQLANLPSSGISDAIWNPATGYLAVHQNGIDNCIMVADGATGWYRVNPYQTPGGYQGPEPIWSPFANITNGCKMVQSVQTGLGIKKLLVGSTTGCNQILFRDLTNFTDNGTQFDAYFVMGSIMLCHPGQIAVIKFLEMDYSGKQFRPIVSFLLNEVAGNFTPFLSNPTFDPPSIYGNTGIPGSYSPNRYYFSSTKSLAKCRHMQIRCDFGKTAVGDELYNLTIFGRLMTTN
jgi:hypothetical protein